VAVSLSILYIKWRSYAIIVFFHKDLKYYFNMAMHGPRHPSAAGSNLRQWAFASSMGLRMPENRTKIVNITAIQISNHVIEYL
jgi:hypothetical protein